MAVMMEERAHRRPVARGARLRPKRGPSAPGHWPARQGRSRAGPGCRGCGTGPPAAGSWQRVAVLSGQTLAGRWQSGREWSARCRPPGQRSERAPRPGRAIGWEVHRQLALPSGQSGGSSVWMADSLFRYCPRSGAAASRLARSVIGAVGLGHAWSCSKNRTRHGTARPQSRAGPPRPLAGEPGSAIRAAGPAIRRCGSFRAARAAGREIKRRAGQQASRSLWHLPLTTSVTFQVPASIGQLEVGAERPRIAGDHD